MTPNQSETIAQITVPFPPFPSQINLLTATIQELQGHLSSGLMTSQQLTHEYLNRIERHNRKGLELRAIIDVAPRENVVKIAKEYDDMRAKGIYLGELHGIPLLIKDSFATDPSLGMRTTAGSVALINSIPKGDATVVAKLRAQGAIIVGKSNLTEFGNFKGDVPWGWSSLGGQTQSAYGPGAYPGELCVHGSSSGSAVGVSAGFAAAATGTETDGSITQPCSAAALFGIKASIGIIPREGILGIASTTDSLGPIAKSAYDTALLLGAMAGCDLSGPAADEARKHIRDDYTQFTKGSNASFAGKRLGVPRDLFFDPRYWNDPRVLSSSGPLPEWKQRYMPQVDTQKVEMARIALQGILSKMESLGAVVVDPANVNIKPHIDFGYEAQNIVYKTEGKEGFTKYLDGLASTDMKDLQDIIDFNNSHADIAFGREGKDSGQTLLLEAQKTSGKGSSEYKEALKTLQNIAAQGMNKVLDDLGLDAMIIPSACWLAPAFSCIGGSPIATVPLGLWESGEPYGLSFLGRKWSEPTLIGLMAAYEANFPPRAVPTAPELAGNTAGDITKS